MELFFFSNNNMKWFIPNEWLKIKKWDIAFISLLSLIEILGESNGKTTTGGQMQRSHFQSLSHWKNLWTIQYDLLLLLLMYKIAQQQIQVYEYVHQVQMFIAELLATKMVENPVSVFWSRNFRTNFPKKQRHFIANYEIRLKTPKFHLKRDVRNLKCFYLRWGYTFWRYTYTGPG